MNYISSINDRLHLTAIAGRVVQAGKATGNAIVRTVANHPDKITLVALSVLGAASFGVLTLPVSASLFGTIALNSLGFYSFGRVVTIPFRMALYQEERTLKNVAKIALYAVMTFGSFSAGLRVLGRIPIKGTPAQQVFKAVIVYISTLFYGFVIGSVTSAIKICKEIHDHQ